MFGCVGAGEVKKRPPTLGAPASACWYKGNANAAGTRPFGFARVSGKTWTRGYSAVNSSGAAVAHLYLALPFLWQRVEYGFSGSAFYGFVVRNRCILSPSAASHEHHG